MRGVACSILLAALSAGCSWSRYDSITEDSPILLLNRPKAVKDGFGSSLATFRNDDGATLLVGGAPLTSGGAEFALGSGDAPAIEARDTGHCLGSPAACYFSESPVAFTRAKEPTGPGDWCFVDGGGVAKDEQGVVVRCVDHVELALPVPKSVDGRITFSIQQSQPTPFRFGADRGTPTSLLASADEEGAVWFYPSGSKKFVEIPNPADTKKGRWENPRRRTLAVARVGESGRLLAVGEPSVGSVRLFFAADSATPAYVGCLGGTPEFGRSLATGPVVGADSDDELVVADGALVYVFDAGRLAELSPTADTGCSLGALPAGALVTSFGCGSTKNISGCSSSDFGAALAVGDLDGDGDGEVVVGAPNMTVRHTKRAGALLIYDVEQEPRAKRELYDFLDIAFLSSAEEDDQLGRSIALPDLGDRQLLVAGAPGNGKAALFYCPSFLPPALAGGRCK